MSQKKRIDAAIIYEFVKGYGMMFSKDGGDNWYPIAELETSLRDEAAIYAAMESYIQETSFR
jgi:hypothetical protein